MINSPENIEFLNRKNEIKRKRRETGENTELIDKRENEKVIDSSFSEANLARIIEGAQLDLNNLKNNPSFRNLSSSNKILALFRIFSEKLNELLSLYSQTVNVDLRHAKQYEEEIKKIRIKQKLLLKKIFGEINEEDSLKIHEREIEELFS